MRRYCNLISAFILILSAPLVFGQDWEVPADQSALENPLDYSLENVKAGKELYTRNCKQCHGDPGKNNPLTLVPMPVDIASEQMHKNSVGELYYKISTGKGVMPPFSGTLSDGERWNLVNFILNYKPGGEVILVEAPPVKAKLLASINEESSTVEIFAEYEKADGGFSTLADVPVLISAKKAFGNIKIGQAKTNASGRAEYIIPEDIIGDEEGMVSVVVSLDENYEATEVALEKALVGKKKKDTTLIRRGVLWSTNDNIQLWLLLSYIFFTGGAWLVIGYVVFQIIKIKRYGRTD